MAHVEKRRQAIILRKQGKSYSQIKSELSVSKSTLSVWLHDYPLSISRIRDLRNNSAARIEKYRNTMREKRNKRLAKYYAEEKDYLFSFSSRELYVAGLFLYLGEGNKASRGTLGIYNNDPSVLKFTLVWYVESLKIKKSDISVYLQLYSDMNIEEEMRYWANVLALPRASFRRPYIKQSTRIGIDHKGFGHGTCGLVVHDTVIKEKIMMALQVITDGYSS